MEEKKRYPWTPLKFKAKRVLTDGLEEGGFGGLGGNKGKENNWFRNEQCIRRGDWRELRAKSERNGHSGEDYQGRIDTQRGYGGGEEGGASRGIQKREGRFNCLQKKRKGEPLWGMWGEEHPCKNTCRGLGSGPRKRIRTTKKERNRPVDRALTDSGSWRGRGSNLVDWGNRQKKKPKKKNKNEIRNWALKGGVI